MEGPLPAEMGLAAAFLLGLLGSSHCAGMCGGISSVLVMGLPPGARRGGPLRLAPWLLAYNGGRIASYTLAGALAGALGLAAAGWIGAELARTVARLVAALCLVVLGLYLAGWGAGLAPLERLGAKVWRALTPAARRLLPVRTLGGAVLAGGIWGWLPCGLVYAGLVLALASGSVAGGATLMLVFGLGTLPTLLAVGYAGGWITEATRHPAFRRTAGVALLVAGVVLAASPGHGIALTPMILGVVELCRNVVSGG